MMAEQNLKRAIMDSVGLTIRHIIASPPLSFQNMMPIDIINAVRAHYGKTTARTARRLDEILAGVCYIVLVWYCVMLYVVK